MVAPRGASKGKPPLAPVAASSSKKTKTKAPSTVKATPAAHTGTRRTSPRHTQSTNTAAATLTTMAVAATMNSATAAPPPADPVCTALFPPPHDHQDDTTRDLVALGDETAGNLLKYSSDSSSDEDSYADSNKNNTTHASAADDDVDIMTTFDHDPNYDDDINDDDDGGINDFAADKYDFNERMHHYMEYTEISSRNVRAVEYCCMVQASTIVYNNQTKGKSELDDNQLTEYLKLVRDIPDSYFVNHQIKKGMLEGYVGMRGKTATRNKDVRTSFHAPVFESIIEYLPSLFQNSEHTFYILTHALQIV